MPYVGKTSYGSWEHMPGRELEAELRVGVSFYTSAPRHSAIRLEPCTTCALACSYCCTRWYRPEAHENKLLKALGRPEVLASVCYSLAR